MVQVITGREDDWVWMLFGGEYVVFHHLYLYVPYPSIEATEVWVIVVHGEFIVCYFVRGVTRSCELYETLAFGE